ncbi:MAG: pitrilysin family protein [Rickettsiales bacterium]|nr:pitrilysin family protein [Rickettsiales bacterium]
MPMRLRLALLLCLACAASAARADSKTPVESFTLANGLEVIVLSNHRLPAVSHMMWFRIGGADDPPGKSGLAHYHEHMMFQGTAKIKAGEFSEVIGRLGGQQNAFTGYDATSYFVNIAKDKLPLVMEMEADRIRGLKPSDADAQKEKEVIIEERRQRVENNPDALLAEQMNAALFRNHPYHTPLIGWMQEMEQLTKQDVLQFHQTYYHPNNAILILSGDITIEEAKPLVQKYYGNLRSQPIPARQWKLEPPHIAPRHIVMRHVTVKQPSWNRTYAVPSLSYSNSADAMPLFVLAQIIGGGKSSRLYQSLIVEQKIASAIDASYNGFTLGPAIFAIEAIPEKTVSPEALEKAIDAELAALAKNGVNDDELLRAKTVLRAEAIYARDGLSGLGHIMGWIRMVGLDKETFNRWPDMVDAVTKEQVNDVLRRALNTNASVTGILLPPEAP